MENIEAASLPCQCISTGPSSAWNLLVIFPLLVAVAILAIQHLQIGDNWQRVPFPDLHRFPCTCTVCSIWQSNLQAVQVNVCCNTCLGSNQIQLLLTFDCCQINTNRCRWGFGLLWYNKFIIQPFQLPRSYNQSHMTKPVCWHLIRIRQVGLGNASIQARNIGIRDEQFNLQWSRSGYCWLFRMFNEHKVINCVA